VLDGSKFILPGTNLPFSAAGTGSDEFGSYTAYLLGGSLADGSSVDGIRSLDYDGGESVVDPSASTGNLIVVNASAVECSVDSAAPGGRSHKRGNAYGNNKIGHNGEMKITIEQLTEAGFRERAAILKASSK
jgi:hypothetical protein